MPSSPSSMPTTALYTKISSLSRPHLVPCLRAPKPGYLAPQWALWALPWRLKPGAVWVIDERDFRLRVLGEFTVIIPRRHPVLCVFGDAFNQLLKLALSEQPGLIVEEIFNFRAGNFLGH